MKEVWLLYLTYAPEYPTKGGTILDNVYGNQESAELALKAKSDDPLLVGYSLSRCEVKYLPEQIDGK